VTRSYRYHLAITSQLPFCGIPFRLDAYSTCQFSCRYCFAAARGGAASGAPIRLADPGKLGRRLERLATSEPRSAIDEMLKARVPIHFGGMSDPFMPMEREHRLTLRYLEILADHSYPVVISTKSALIADDEYVRELARGKFVVQFSFSRRRNTQFLEGGAPNAEQRIQTLRRLAVAGIGTAIRIQPLLPNFESEAIDLIDEAAEAGARHVSVEHLKLPIEREWSHRTRMDRAVGFDLGEFYRQRSARRVGREWILPVEYRHPTIAALRDRAVHSKIGFGAADNDLLHWSDGNVCCSGADLFKLGSGFQFNFTTAVRRGIRAGRISFDLIRSDWRPSHPITEYVNSHSRMGHSQTVESYLVARWNGAKNGPSPASFYGVNSTLDVDSDGLQIYEIQTSALPHWLQQSRVAASHSYHSAA
jgi:DNA repair photolyase